MWWSCYQGIIVLLDLDILFYTMPHHMTLYYTVLYHSVYGTVRGVAAGQEV